jgi:hypothetical protein
MKEPIGRIHTTTTTEKAGKCTKAIGTARTTTITIGETTITGAGMVTTTTVSTSTTTSR